MRLLMLAALFALQCTAADGFRLKRMLEHGPLQVMVFDGPLCSGEVRCPSHGVSVFSSNPDTEAFRITIAYKLNGKVGSVSSTIQRVKYSDVTWTGDSFWIGEGARILSVTVEEVKRVVFDLAADEP